MHLGPTAIEALLLGCLLDGTAAAAHALMLPHCIAARQQLLHPTSSAAPVPYSACRTV